MACTRDRTTMSTKLSLIAERAKGDKGKRIENVACLLDAGSLRESYGQLKSGKACGVDGMSVEEYGENLDENIKNLVERMKRNAYYPQPVRRTYIPKANGKLRPLGIPAVEDKIVQHGIARILGTIYETEFLDFSYGFRPQRSCHQALERLDRLVMTKPINYVIDADIKGFFDNVSHAWMMKFLAHRISDTRLLRLIEKFLKNGYMEEGTLFASEKGTPQGGIVSPVLANIYLHYVLDLWFERRVKPGCKGIVEMIRYADDFVICAQHREDAVKIHELLQARLEGFCLELAAEKTRIIEFGRSAGSKRRIMGRKPETFNFLGFTHYCGKSRKGNFLLGRKTDRKKLHAKLSEMTQWLRSVRNKCKVREWWPILKAKLVGHYRYYGVSGNTRSLNQFYRLVQHLVFKWMNRRSQMKSFTWDNYAQYLKRHPLPTPSVYHNFYVNYGN